MTCTCDSPCEANHYLNALHIASRFTSIPHRAYTACGEGMSIIFCLLTFLSNNSDCGTRSVLLLIRQL